MISHSWSETLWLLPSMVRRKLWLRLVTFIRMVHSSLMTKLLTFILLVSTAVITTLPYRGATIGPPLLSEYPVEPVGVETISPSD